VQTIALLFAGERGKRPFKAAHAITCGLLGEFVKGHPSNAWRCRVFQGCIVTNWRHEMSELIGLG